MILHQNMQGFQHKITCTPPPPGSQISELCQESHEFHGGPWARLENCNFSKGKPQPLRVKQHEWTSPYELSTCALVGFEMMTDTHMDRQCLMPPIFSGHVSITIQRTWVSWTGGQETYDDIHTNLSWWKAGWVMR